MKRLIATLTLLLAFSALTARAQEEPMPLEIHERLWVNPGPVQDGPDAPKLLLVSPRGDDTIRTTGESIGFRGRVEPESATFSVNGEQIKIWPGGVFFGSAQLKNQPSQTVVFEAEHDGKKTRVQRAVERREPAPPLPRRPIRFADDPVSPTGDFWLPRGEKLEVFLWASEDAVAEARLGGDSEWLPMKPQGRPGRNGQRYTVELEPRKGHQRSRAEVADFSIRAADESAGAQPQVHRSRLRIGLMPEDPPLGRVTKNVGTFLKNDEGWERWGNWIAGTPFPVLEVRGDRIRTDFGAQPSGWVELENAKVEFDKQFGSRPRLPSPELIENKSDIALAWNQRESPVAVAFEHEASPQGDSLIVRVPGAESIPNKTFHPHENGPARAIEIHSEAASRGAAPRIEFRLREALWGFGVHGKPFGIEARTRPRLPNATKVKPLSGLRVMIDAGHGGEDLGAIGPSGIAEADLNLVQAAWLEKFLGEMGAETRQIRRKHETIELDARVDMALAWDPDLFISLHHNSSGGNPLADEGPIVFYHYAHSKPLADAIAARLAPSWGAPLARTLPQVFRVNRNVSLCPSVLVETAFVNNPNDEVRLRRTETIKSTAQAIAQAVRGYMEAK